MTCSNTHLCNRFHLLHHSKLCGILAYNTRLHELIFRWLHRGRPFLVKKPLCCVCVCFPLRLRKAVFPYSELPQLWLFPNDDITRPYPWRLWRYFLEMAFLRVPTKPNIVGPTTQQHRWLACSQPRYLAPPGPRRHWEADGSVDRAWCPLGVTFLSRE